MLCRANTRLGTYFGDFFPGTSGQAAHTPRPRRPKGGSVTNGREPPGAVSYHLLDGGGLLRPRQDDHLQVELARADASHVSSRPGVTGDAASRGVRATRLSPARCGREEDGPGEGGHERPVEGVGEDRRRGAR